MPLIDSTTGRSVLGWLALLLLACPVRELRAQSLLTQWRGSPNHTGGFEPADPHGAPGPKGVLQVLNKHIFYYDKTGNKLWGDGLWTLFKPVGCTGLSMSDPKACFDPETGRFFVIIEEIAPDLRSYVNIGVSKSSHPATSTVDDWHLYRFDMTQTIGVTNYGGDYPSLAFDSQALYIWYEMSQISPDSGTFDPSFGGYGSQLIILNKAQLVSGTASGFNPLFIADFLFQGVTPVGATDPGNVVYLVSTGVDAESHNDLFLIAVSDPLGNATISETKIALPGVTLCCPSSAPQLGTNSTVDTAILVGGAAAQGNAFWHDGDIWFCQTGVTNGRAQVYFVRLRPNGYPNGTPALVESGAVGEPDYWNFIPAIGGNAAGDVCMVYTRSSETIYPTMMYAFRAAGDSSFGSPQVVKVSDSYYTGDRWGDYASSWPDPVDGTFWITHEYARSTRQADWGTWWAQVSSPPYDLYVDWRNFFFPEIGTPLFPFRTVTKAVKAATHGTIQIYTGHYNETLTINKAVKLLAEGGTVLLGAP